MTLSSSEFADAVVVSVADVDRAIGGDRGAVRPVECGGAGRTAVAALRGLTGAGEGPDDPRGEIDDPHAVVRDIGNVEPVLCRVERQAVRLDHACARGWTVIAAEPGGAIAGQGRDDARAAVDPA